MRISVVVLLLCACASACASKEAQVESPAEPATISPGNVSRGNEEALDLDAAALRFERAEQDLGELLARHDGSKVGEGAPAGDDAKPSGPPPAPELDRPTESPPEATPDTNQPGPARPSPPVGPGAVPPSDGLRASELASSRAQRCARACDALQIMKRSAARLCDLTGSDDPRCSDVTQRHERADERVRKACPECS